MHVSQYHAALARLADSPLELTERDFDVLLEFGGPQKWFAPGNRTTRECSSSG